MPFGRSLALLPCCLLACLCPGVASATPFWKGDFETGDLKQWSYLLNPNDDGLSVVSTPVADGKNAVKIEISADDLWSNGLNRVELQYAPPAAYTKTGSEVYFGWSLYVPELLTQESHQIGYWETTVSYQQLFHVAAFGSKVALRTQKPSYQEKWSEDGLLTPGQWHRVVWHIVWSTDAATASVELWWDGVHKVKAAVPTYGDNPAFTQLGILRDTIAKTEVMYVDDARAGATLDDVLGSVPGGAGGGSAGGGSAGGSSAGGSSAGGSSTAGVGGSASEAGASAGGVGVGGTAMEPGSGGSGADPLAGRGGAPATSSAGSGGAPAASGAAATAAPDDSSCAIRALRPSAGAWLTGLAMALSLALRRRALRRRP